MTLYCSICLHTPPGDRVAAEAITVMAGQAVCEEHIEDLSLPPHVQELIIEAYEKRLGT